MRVITFLICFCFASLFILTSCSKYNEQDTLDTTTGIVTEITDETNTESPIEEYSESASVIADSIGDKASKKEISTSAETTQLNSNEHSTEQTYSNEVMLVVIYESFASSYQQNVYVLDEEGNIYDASYSDIPYISSSMPDRFSFDKDDWHEKLKEITQTESSEKLEAYIADGIRDLTGRFQNCKDYPFKQYPEATADYGIQYMYGIYYDENNVPQNVLLCSFGDAVTCIDDSNVIRLVNELSNTSFFYTIGFKY